MNKKSTKTIRVPYGYSVHGPEEIKAVEKNLWLKIRSKLLDGRRTGLSCIGLADCFAGLDRIYASKDSINLAEEIYKQLGGHATSLDRKLPTRVFDANQHVICDPITFGIIEPAKVVRVSIANALSVASLLTTIGGIVVTPRNSDLEQQMELANQAFSNMMQGE